MKNVFITIYRRNTPVYTAPFSFSLVLQIRKTVSKNREKEFSYRIVTR
jgi:hypothetical protein